MTPDCILLVLVVANLGDAAGVSTGAAWRAALEAACEVGSQQVLLGKYAESNEQTYRQLAKLQHGKQMAVTLS